MLASPKGQTGLPTLCTCVIEPATGQANHFNRQHLPSASSQCTGKHRFPDNL